ILKFDLPNETQIKQLLAIKLRSIRNNFFKQASIFKKFKGLSHADIERILRRAIKTMVLDKREILELQDIEESLLKEKARKQESKRKR
ncbi:MAG: ATP-binding protein, partial [Candidatus Pacearchaeota archaeon]